MFYKNIHAFTLVELIVVITIVGILSTVGFVSYSSYLTGARDSNRVSQMVKLSDSLQTYATTKSLPLPDNKVEITASGVLIAYQGDVGEDILETIDFSNGGKDPKDGNFYTYYVTRDKKNMQLLALMESQNITASRTFLNTSSFAQFEDRTPKVYGSKLGVLTEDFTNIPVQLLSEYDTQPFDLVNQSSVFTAHLSDDEKITGDGEFLSSSISNRNCNRIKQTGKAKGSGIYQIYSSEGFVDVYCEMDVAGGGWTLVARTHPSSTISDISFTVPDGGSILDDSDAYKYIGDSLSFSTVTNFHDINIRKTTFVHLYATYTSGKNIDIAYTRSSTYDPNNPGPNVEICKDVVGVSGVLPDCSNVPGFNMTGFDGSGGSNVINRQAMYFYKEVFQ